MAKIATGVGSAAGMQTGPQGGGAERAAAKATAAESSTAQAGGALRADAGGSVSATTTASGDISLGQMIETAMADAILNIQSESEAIQAETGATDADKKARLDALNAPANVHARMMQARSRVKTDWDTLYAAAQKL